MSIVVCALFTAVFNYILGLWFLAGLLLFVAGAFTFAAEWFYRVTGGR